MLICLVGTGVLDCPFLSKKMLLKKHGGSKPPPYEKSADTKSICRKAL